MHTHTLDWHNDLLDRALPDDANRLAWPIRDFTEWLLWRMPGWAEFTAIHPDRSLPLVTQWAHCADNAELTKAAIRSARLNLEGYSVYVGVCPRRQSRPEGQRGRAADAVAVPALWCEIDDDSDDALRRLEHFDPLPSIILHSGGGFHAYWSLSPVPQPSDTIKRILRGIALEVEGDTSVAEFARIMRLPGSINTKPGRGGRRVMILGGRRDATYHIEDFAHYEEQAPRQAARVPVPHTFKSDVPQWIEENLSLPPVQGDRNNTLYRMAATLKDHGWDEQDVHGLVPTNWASLRQDEITRTIHSAFQKAPRGVSVRQNPDLALMNARRNRR